MKLPRRLCLSVVAVLLASSVGEAGPYLGLFAGYDDASEAWSQQGRELSPEGVVAGGFLGTEWRFGILMAGGEADLMFADMSESEPCDATLAERSLDGRVMGSFRVRGGFVIEQALIYATAGPALSYVRVSADGPGGTSDSQLLAGWTLGLGGELALHDGLRLSLEYRHTDYGASDFTIVHGGADERIRFETDEVTLRLSIHLD